METPLQRKTRLQKERRRQQRGDVGPIGRPRGSTPRDSAGKPCAWVNGSWYDTQLIWQAETPKKLKQAKLGGGSS